MSNIDLRLGDCIEVMKTIKDASIGLIVTDPPYWHKKSPATNTKNKFYEKSTSDFSKTDLFRGDGFMMKEMSDFTGEDVEVLMNEFERICKPLNAYIFCNETLIPYYSMWAEKNKHHFTILTWEKPLSIINKNRFSQNTEFIIRIYDYGTGLNSISNNEAYNRVKRHNPVFGANKLHPTQKPISIIGELLDLSYREGNVVLDPFMGSGTTAVACFKKSIKFIGIEKDLDIFEVAENRVEKAKIDKSEELDFDSLIIT